MPRKVQNPEFALVPMALGIPDGHSFRSCQVLPGVKLCRMSAELRNSIESQAPLPHWVRGFYPSHALLVDHKEYSEALAARIGQSRNNWPVSGVELDSLVKQTILALNLGGVVSFQVNGSYQYRALGRRPRPCSMQPRPSESMNRTMQSIEPATWPSNRVLRSTALELDRYYRGISWWSDPFGVALGCLWNSLIANTLDHAFVGMSMALEAALVSPREGIAHTLAERAKVVTGDPGIYGQMKSLYDVRSNLVHGRAAPKKGPVNWESLSVTAKGTVVPVSKLRLMRRVTFRVLAAVLRHKEYLAVLQAKRSEKKTREAVREFFGAQ